MKRILIFGLFILLILSNLITIIYLNGRDYYVFHKTGQDRLWIGTLECNLVIDSPYIYRLNASGDLNLHLSDSNSPLISPDFESSSISIEKNRIDMIAEFEEVKNSQHTYFFSKETFKNLTVYTVDTLIRNDHEGKISASQKLSETDISRAVYLVFENIFIRIIGKDTGNWKIIAKDCMDQPPE